MPRQWTDEQKQAARERMEKVRAARKTKTPETKIEEAQEPTQPVSSPANQEYAELQRQVEELKSMFAQSQALNQAFLAGAQSNGSSPQLNNGRLVGTVEKYSVDSSRYVDPRTRLYNEPRLARIAFETNYELDWEIGVTSYETRDGVNTKEPKFNLKLNRIIMDDEGEPTDRRAKICQLVFFEDPATAMVIANQNGLRVDEDNQTEFLNEMRYLRMRDWLFECFWPAKIKQNSGIHEEVINGQLVEVFTVNTEASQGANIPFSTMNPNKKLRV